MIQQPVTIDLQAELEFTRQSKVRSTVTDRQSRAGTSKLSNYLQVRPRFEEMPLKRMSEWGAKEQAERDAEIASELKREQQPKTSIQRTSIQVEDDEDDVSRLNMTGDFKMT